MGNSVGETQPTTIPGLLAMVTYAAEIREYDKQAFTDRHCMLIENLALAANALTERQVMTEAVTAA